MATRDKSDIISLALLVVVGRLGVVTEAAIGQVPLNAASIVFVLEQQGHARECSTARLAIVLFDYGMGLQVSSQVGSVGECSIAVLAREWLLSGVRANVTWGWKGTISHCCHWTRTRDLP